MNRLLFTAALTLTSMPAPAQMGRARDFPDLPSGGGAGGVIFVAGLVVAFVIYAVVMNIREGNAWEGAKIALMAIIGLPALAGFIWLLSYS